MSKRPKPGKWKTLLARAAAHGEAGEHSQAEALWREYLAHDSNHPAVNFNLAWCLEKRADSPRDRLKAAEFYEKVLSSPAADLELKANAMNQIGLMCLTIGDCEKAAVSFGFALKIDPNHGAARINLADAHRALGQYELAQGEYAGILEQSPDNPEAMMCAGMLALLLGDYPRGWDLYRARWRVKTFTTKSFVSKRPQWAGERLAGKTLMLTEEQGFGDSMQFIRYAALFHALGARVLFGCQPALRPLMGGVYGLAAAVPRDDSVEFNYYLPLLDAPHMAGTTLENIPAAHCIRPMTGWPHWSLTGNLLRPRIGLVWAGSPTHGKDGARSVPPESFQPLIDAHPHCDFYSLQAGPRAHEAARLRGATDLAPQITGWTDTAQMLACMNLLISVDTACVHLAGAVGTPVWMLCPYSPDFRWMLGREESPWYPKLRLFRQPDAKDWQTPLERINDALTHC